MSRILRRPMFRGGRVSSYGTGITSGLADGGMPDKRGLVTGPGGYQGRGKRIPQQYKEKILSPSYFGQGTGRYGLQGIGGPMFTGQQIMDFQTGYPKLGTTYAHNLAPSATYAYEAMNDEMRSIMQNMLDPETMLIDPDKIDVETGEVIEEEKIDTPDDEYISPTMTMKEKEWSGEIDSSPSKAAVEDSVLFDEDEVATEEATDVSLGELADEYYRQLKGERGERDKKRVKEARGQDISDWLLKYSEKALKEDATALGAAGETAGWIADRPSRTEIIQEKITDKDDRLREAGAQIAITEKIGDKKLDKTFANQLKLMDKRVAGAVAAAMAKLPTLTDFDKVQDIITDKDSSSQSKALAFLKLGLSDSFTADADRRADKYQKNIKDIEAIGMANTYFGAFTDKPIIMVETIDLKKDGIQVDTTNKKVVLIKDGEYSIIGDYKGG
jgi:hypothetical protein